MKRIAIVAAAAAILVPAHSAEPLFSFGVVADVQYADKDTALGREYRKSPAKLAQCVAALNKERLAFVIQLGDFIDAGIDNIGVVQTVFNKLRAPKHSVLGNHDFCADRASILKKFGMAAAYYQYSSNGWRFVVLDGMNESVAGGWAVDDPHAVAGRNALETLRAKGSRNAQTWNGAVGDVQRAWLRTVLRDAGDRHERAIVFCHFPVLPASCRPEHLLWDYQAVLDVLESQPAVAAFMNGHDHKGGYGFQGGIHFLTFPGIVEHEADESCQVVDVYPRSLIVRQAGRAPALRTLQLR